MCGLVVGQTSATYRLGRDTSSQLGTQLDIDKKMDATQSKMINVFEVKKPHKCPDYGHRLINTYPISWFIWQVLSQKLAIVNVCFFFLIIIMSCCCLVVLMLFLLCIDLHNIHEMCVNEKKIKHSELFNILS